MVPSISNMLSQAAKGASRSERAAILKQYDCFGLRTILQYCFHPLVESLLPKGNPPYEPCKFPDQEGRLHKEARKLTYFVKGGGDNLTGPKRENLFVTILESIDPADAELLCAVKDKKMPYKGITPAVVKEAFPDLLPDEQTAE